MSILDVIRKEMKPFEVRAMANAVLKEGSMLAARAEAIQKLAKNEDDPLKVVEYCAEVAMIDRLIKTLETISEETLLEAEKQNMIKK